MAAISEEAQVRRVSSIYRIGVCQAPYIAAKTPPAIRKVFYSCTANEKASTGKKDENYEAVRIDSSIDHIDIKKLSAEIQQIFKEAQEIAKNQKSGMTGPLSDSLPSLLARHIENKKD
jgi:hypothetical protein